MQVGEDVILQKEVEDPRLILVTPQDVLCSGRREVMLVESSHLLQDERCSHVLYRLVEQHETVWVRQPSCIYLQLCGWSLPLLPGCAL